MSFLSSSSRVNVCQSRHSLVASYTSISPGVPFDGLKRGQVVMIWSAVCSAAPHSQAGLGNQAPIGICWLDRQFRMNLLGSGSIVDLLLTNSTYFWILIFLLAMAICFWFALMAFHSFPTSVGKNGLWRCKRKVYNQPTTNPSLNQSIFLTSLDASMLAPWASNSLMISECPIWEAIHRGVALS